MQSIPCDVLDTKSGVGSRGSGLLKTAQPARDASGLKPDYMELCYWCLRGSGRYKLGTSIWGTST